VLHAGEGQEQAEIILSRGAILSMIKNLKLRAHITGGQKKGGKERGEAVPRPTSLSWEEQTPLKSKIAEHEKRGKDQRVEPVVHV